MCLTDLSPAFPLAGRFCARTVTGSVRRPPRSIRPPLAGDPPRRGSDAGVVDDPGRKVGHFPLQVVRLHVPAQPLDHRGIRGPERLAAEHRGGLAGDVVEVEAGRASVLQNDLAADQHGIDVAGAGAHQQELAWIGLRRDPGPGHAVQIDEHHVGGTAGRDGTERAFLAQQARPARRRHLQHLGRLRRRPVEAGGAVQAHGEAHLVEVVLVVVDGGAVHPEPDGDPAREHRVERGDAGPQAQVRARVVGHPGAGLGHELDLGVGQPHPVGDGEARSEDAEVEQVPDGRLSVVAGSVQHLVERFRDVRLHAGVAGLRLLGDALHEGVRHPLRPRRRIPDVDAVVPAMASPQVVDDSEVVVLVEVVRRRHAARGEATELVVGQAGQEFLVLAGSGDEEALGHEPRREGHADAGVVVRVEGLAGIGRIVVRGAPVAVYVDHAGDAGAQQPRRAQQGIESRCEAPTQREREQPGLQQPVPDPLLYSGDAVAVMMGVDHAGHDRDAFGAEDRRVRVPAAQGLPVSDLGDRAVLDADRSIAQHRIVFPASSDNPSPSNQHRIAHRPQPPSEPRASELEPPARPERPRSVPAGDDPAYADRPIAAVPVQPDPGDGSVVLPGEFRFGRSSRYAVRCARSPSTLARRHPTWHRCAEGVRLRADATG